MPQHRQINFSSLRKCSLPFFPIVFETTNGSLKSAVGSRCGPRVSGSPSLIYNMSAKFRENNADFALLHFGSVLATLQCACSQLLM